MHVHDQSAHSIFIKPFTIYFNKQKALVSTGIVPVKFTTYEISQCIDNMYMQFN